MKLFEMPSYPDDFLLDRNLTIFVISFLVTCVKNIELWTCSSKQSIELVLYDKCFVALEPKLTKNSLKLVSV